MITDTKIINKDIKSRARKKLQKELRLKKEYRIAKEQGRIFKNRNRKCRKKICYCLHLY